MENNIINTKKAPLLLRPRKLGRKVRNQIIKRLPPNVLFYFIEKALTEIKPIEPLPGHIVIICGSLQPGGAERQVANTLIGLRSPQVKDVKLICDRIHSNENEDYDFYLSLAKSSNWEVREIHKDWGDLHQDNLPKYFYILEKYVNKKLAADVANLYYEFHRLRPEVVHAWLDWSNVRAGLAAILAGVPRIVLSGRNYSPRHFLLNTPYFHPAYRAIMKNNSSKVWLLNNSQAGAADYADWLSISVDRIKVLRNSVDFSDDMRPAIKSKEEFRSKLNIPIDAKVVGGMFRFNPEKDPLLWLEVAEKVAKLKSNVYFILFGNGSMRAEMEKRINGSILKNRINLYGIVSPSINGLYACDTVLLTSTLEGTPNVLLETQWLGIPVVTTNAGGAAEAVSEGVTGYVINSRNSSDLSDAVVKCLFDDKIRESATESGANFVAERFGMQRMIDETLSVYNL